MLAIWIAGAFFLGLIARQIGMPPLVGFLLAGFGFRALGMEPDETLNELAHLGVLMLLFMVGLKLRLRDVVRGEVLGTALLHLLVAAVVGAAILGATLRLETNTAWTLAIALGFSSTVMAAKMLEMRREVRAFHGRMAIGILIIQDLVAVALVTLSDGQMPSPWVFSLVLLPLARWLIWRLLDHMGHGEMLVLFGALLALTVGGTGFELMGLSGELGALVLGMLLADHSRAQELSNAMWALRDLFLVGFFVAIGMTGLPTWDIAGLALLLALALPVKAILFFALMLSFGLRARTGFLGALSLATYSEFGLIVTQAAVLQGGLSPYWLTLMAVTVAISFVIAGPLNHFAHPLYQLLEPWLCSLQREKRHPDDQPASLGSARVVIVGMGRVGTSAYQYFQEKQIAVAGLEHDPGKLVRHREKGRKVVYADAEDPGFWQALNLEKVEAVMLALPDLEAKVIATEQLRRRGFAGLISATHVYSEEQAPILKAGADVTYNYFGEAGVGFAAHTLQFVEDQSA